MGKKRPKSKTSKQLTSKNDSYAIDSIQDDIIAAALTSVAQPVLIKVCRLCESKDGPFLNIFGADKLIAKKIDEIMPFAIEENDDLPHKICFRCSAKVEELYEFIQKCINTQQSLRTAIGKRGPLVTKTKDHVRWEQKLHKSNMSNDDICNALIKKAMEGIKEMPLNLLHSDEDNLPLSASKKSKASTEPSISSKKDKDPPAMSSKNNIPNQSDDESEEINLKQVKLSIEKCDDKISLNKRPLRLKKPESTIMETEQPKKPNPIPPRKSQSKEQESVDNKSSNNVKQNNIEIIKTTSSSETNNKSETDIQKSVDLPAKVPETPAPINIMDHVSTIKVNGVGTLFLCKLCNRNFLKKEVVMNHGCAKNNVPKDNFILNNAPAPELPKPSTVKYIKLDNNFKKPVISESNKPVDKKSTSPDTKQVNIPVQPEAKPKPKVGPASKVKRNTRNENSEVLTQPPPKVDVSQENKQVISTPSVNFPDLPSLNSLYKLVPGPNNQYTLVEDSRSATEEKKSSNKKRKATTSDNDTVIKSKNHRPSTVEEDTSQNVIDLDDNVETPPVSIQRPYPVGLFQTVPHHSGVFAPSTHPAPPTFTTPAMKKHSYTVVQTGNPSKLLISSKPQPLAEEVLRRKAKKSKEISKQPYNVTIEDTGTSKDPGYFTFINVDPLLQPSYVLPTDSIIQESQISTSTPAAKRVIDNKDDEKYDCNMCGEKFSREKKLLAHIQSHYNQMDEEDQMRSVKAGPKRKTRKI